MVIYELTLNWRSMMKIKLIIGIVAVLALTGCATGCERSCILGFGPGNPLFNKLADSADSSDECQTREFSSLTGQRLKQPGHQAPDFCKMRGRTQYELRDKTGRLVGIIQQR